jgi:hypothetical protein
MVQGHEAEGRIQPWVDHLHVEVIHGVDRLPVVKRGTAEGIDPQGQPRTADHVHVDGGGQIVDVGSDEVLLVGGGCLHGPGRRHALDGLVPAAKQGVGAVADPRGYVGVGGAAVGRVVLETAVFRGIVRGRDHDAVGQSPEMAPV